MLTQLLPHIPLRLSPGLEAAAGTVLCVQALALRRRWVGLLMPPLRTLGERWELVLGCSFPLWVAASISAPAAAAFAPLLAGVVGGLVAALLLSVLKPIDPDSRFVPGPALQDSPVRLVAGADPLDRPVRLVARADPLDSPARLAAGADPLDRPARLVAGADHPVAGTRPLRPRHPELRIEALELPGDPDAGALLLEPLEPDVRGLVVLCHGGGNDRLCGLWLLVDTLLSRGYTVLTAHLAGHGRGGSDLFTLERCRERVNALVQLAHSRTSGPVVLLGQSMGGAFVLDHLAGDRRPGGSGADAVVSVSAPVSLHVKMQILKELGTFWRALAALRYGTPDRLMPAYGSFRREVYPIRLEAGERDYVAAFRETLDALDLRNRLRDARDCATPLLVVHGVRDGVVPLSQAAEIRDAAGNSELMEIPGLHHLDVLLDPPSVMRIIDWIDARCRQRQALVGGVPAPLPRSL